jgi:hypothetical protein
VQAYNTLQRVCGAASKLEVIQSYYPASDTPRRSPPSMFDAQLNAASIGHCRPGGRVLDENLKLTKQNYAAKDAAQLRD